MRENKLDMRLVHFTDGPLQELAAQVKSQGSLEASRNYLGNPFYSTDEDLLDDLRKTFKRYETAKIEFDAPIVPNLSLIRTKKKSFANQPDAIRRPSQNTDKSILSKEPDQC